MCTVILLYKLHPAYPVIIAGNRDEFLARPALAPHLWKTAGQGQEITILAGRDQRAGGTWMGINQFGLVTGVTNRFTGSRDPDKRSRGQLVLQCLAQEVPEQTKEGLTAHEASQYNPFNLFCLSRESGFLFTNYPEAHLQPLTKGVHILTNRAIEDPEDKKWNWLNSQFREPPSDPGTVERLLEQALRCHGKEADSEPVCIHLEGYGTVSSFVAFLGNINGKSTYKYCEGPPCRDSYQDLSATLHMLLGVQE